MYIEKKLKEGSILEQKIRKLEEYAEELGIVINYEAEGLRFSFPGNNQVVVKRDNGETLLASDSVFYYLDSDSLEPSPSFPSPFETTIGIFT